MDYTLPPQITNVRGKKRNVGFELEFAGLDLPEIAEIIKQQYKGTIDKHTNAHYSINHTELGDFKVEIDASLLKKMSEQRWSDKWGFERGRPLEENIETWINKLAQTVVPVEIVMPPVSVTKLDCFVSLFNQLREHQAEGTESSWMHAFGLHINVEVPDLQVETILPQFQAFLLLYPWLVDVLDINLARRLTPYIAPFPAMYTAKIVQEHYKPDMEGFITDYLRENDTRNRPLDLIPLFLHINRPLVEKLMKITKSNSRPTYHYRLPNSNVQDKNWSYLQEWEAWVLVEQLAAQPDLLQTLQQHYSRIKPYDLTTLQSEWINQVDTFTNEHFQTHHWRNRTR